MLFYSLHAPCLQCRLCGLRDFVVSPFVCVVCFSRGRWFFLLACVWGLRWVCIAIACVKDCSTLRSSRTAPHPSTNPALRRLTSEVGRDPVHSTRYDCQRVSMTMASHAVLCLALVVFLMVLCLQSWQHPEVFPGAPPPQH